MSKDPVSKQSAADLRVRAESAKRRAASSDTEQEKQTHLRRMKEFEKLASEVERKEKRVIDTNSGRAPVNPPLHNKGSQ